MSQFYLDTEDILKITGQRFYRRGVDLYNKGRVINLKYNTAINSWSATVKGGNAYRVNVFFFEDDDLEAKCDCAAYKTHYTCKHIAAVLLSISKHQDHQTTFPKKETAQRTDPFPLRMIELFEAEKTQETSAKETKLNVHYQIEEQRLHYAKGTYFDVQLKVGESQLYIVKDLAKFLKAIDSNQTLRITATFSYRPAEHAFDPVDLELFDLIKQAIKHEEIYSTELPEMEQREISLPPFLFKQFLEKMASRSVQLIKENKTVSTKINLLEKLPKITFPIELNKDQSFTVNFKDFFAYQFSSYYQFIHSGDDFYFLSPDEKTTFEQMHTILPYRQKNIYHISKDKMTYFIGYVLPKLKSIGQVEISEKAKQEIKKDPLEIKLYLETHKEALNLSVTFQYGKHQFNPNQSNQTTETVMVRDFQAEQDLLNLLKESGFRVLNQSHWLFNEEKIYQFIYHILPELMEETQVFMSDQVKALRAEQNYQLETNIEVDGLTGMLDVSFNIEGISEKDISAVLQALVEKKTYHRLTNGPILELTDDTFHSFQSLADELNLKKRDLSEPHLELAPAKGIQVDHALQEKQSHYSETFKELLTALKEPQAVKDQVPDTLTAELRDYQVVGYRWFNSLARYQLGGILADEMGLGKTIQAISFILSQKEKERAHPSIVIAPASLIFNWKKEFKMFAPSLNVDVIMGTKTERLEKIEANDKPDVWITSYPLIRQDIEDYQDIFFDVLILDEAQAIKNHLTQTAKATRKIQARQRFALSGTPIENRLEELWSIFQTISPGFLGSKQDFVQYPTDYIRKITKPFILRRLKEDVLPELPEKLEFEKYSELTKEQKEIYLAYVDRIQQKLDSVIESDQFGQEKIEILAGLTRLRQICCHPSLFLENYQGESGKLELLLTIVEQLRAENRRILIFSQFASMLHIIGEELAKYGYQTFHLDGQTPIKDRVNMTEAFNQGEKEIFIVSLKAGGTGLNLTGADTVILFDLWWNPAVEEQAAGRAHRIGQTKKVEVIRLITEGTIEEKIFQLQEKKRKLVDEVIQPGETLLSSLSANELKELLTFER